MDKSKENELPRCRRRTVIQSERYKEWQQELLSNRFIHKKKCMNAPETSEKEKGEEKREDETGEGEKEEEGGGEKKKRHVHKEKREEKNDMLKSKWLNIQEGYHLRSTTNSLKSKKSSPSKSPSSKKNEEVAKKEGGLKRKYEKRVDKERSVKIQKTDSKMVHENKTSKSNNSHNEKDVKETKEAKENKERKPRKDEMMENNGCLHEKSNLSLCSKKGAKKSGQSNLRNKDCEEKCCNNSHSENCNLSNKTNQEKDCGESRKSDSSDWRNDYALNREIRSKRNAERQAEDMKKEEKWLEMARNTPKLKICLTREEVREDFIKITGKPCSGKPKKSTLISKGLALGLCLMDPHWYKY